ncbi:Peptidase M13 [Chamberlinius hualienensis]
MTKYKRTDFDEDETSSNGSVLTESVIPSLGPTRIVYNKGNDLWNSRSLLEKCLIVLSVLLIFVVIILSSLVSFLRKPQPIRVIYVDHHNQTSNTTTTGSNLCLSPECITVASSIINAMDLKINPCDDFYQYACGGWVKANPIPEGKSIWGTFGKLWQENQLVMKNVLEKNLSATAGSAERKAQIYYLSCMDRNSTIEKLGSKPMIDLIKQIGGWNISGQFDIKKWSLQKTLEIVHNVYNMGGLFSWAVGEDDRNSSTHVMQIDQGGLTLPTRDYYLNKSADDKVLVAYLTYMTDVGVILGGEENSTRDQMKKVIDLEIEIANITIPSYERRNEEKLYHKMNISDLTHLASFLNWVQYFNSAFKSVNRTIVPSDDIVVYAPDFLTNLTMIIERYHSSDEGKIVLNNYLMWQVIRPLVPALSKPFRDAAKILQKALIGTEGGEEPWRFCVSDTNNVIGFALGAMFVREVFHGESKPVAEEMIEDIRTAFKKNLDQLDWMDSKTKQLAKEKADAISDMIGFPDYILNTSELDKKYADVQFNKSEYFANNIAIIEFDLQKNLERLGKPVNASRWGMSPPTVNAYYTPTKNQIVFPAGILQAPFYDISYPRSLNFGAMGVVMGHELTHAFDDQGGGYDKFGNLHQWWENSTMEQFQKRTQCMVDQYSNYTENGENLNGRQTLGENIADNGGIKAAFKAYEDWILLKGEELPLPGVNLTHRQLFFIGFSQVWCSSSTSQATHLQIVNDPHSLSKFRVLGTLKNSYDFANNFNCTVGSSMNPAKKCEIW